MPGCLSQATFQVTGGFIGVDLFFVVSGFLITGLLIRERERTAGSASPVLRPSSAAHPARGRGRAAGHDPLSSSIVLVTDPAPSTMEDAATAALSVANIRFAITTDYFNPISYSPFLHFWSLGVEEQFYFVWPRPAVRRGVAPPAPGGGPCPRGGGRGLVRGQRLMTNSNPSGLLHAADAGLAARRRRPAGGRRGLARPGARGVPAGIGQLLVVFGWLALAALFVDAFALDSTSRTRASRRSYRR